MFRRPSLRLITLLAFLCAAAGAGYGCKQSGPVPPTEVPDGMVWIAPNGESEGFFMDATETTVAEFRAFVEATNFVTEAEEFGWSGVFNRDSLNWLPVDSATWDQPLGPVPGPDSLVQNAAPAAAPANTPVTQVSMRDVQAYLKWAGKELPTEKEWMHAASQSGKYGDFPWGTEMVPDGKFPGNWWQGPFPFNDEVLDGFPGIAPVKSFPPAENGLYDISGNVWEWTASKAPDGTYIIKGGSFLCSTSYCTGFNLKQRQTTPADSGLNHLGFRGIIRPSK
ncbi:SUMF1/EgtB/PvdO family nonheme iron enzyme [Lewinella sp. 4G2]|uniref:formylglycine-generating enzyme family protein n=1 Tax=Lewinella sp. 4G2 TaxID=1803372 RepID=UPI0007B489AE|nr:SUMF1/EgtB/PvdO family nonheme iron enzyme [Lewinella sp. 4G2]OAV45579.1 hypothetical protein A3850_014235 [Lewinella sp. 4G2]